MDFYKRELLVYRICCGYIKFNVNDDFCIYIHTPEQNTKYIAQQKYVEAYEFALENEVSTIDDIVNVLKSYDMWSDDKDKLLDDLLPEKIENLKVDIYKANLDIERREAFRKELRSCEEKLNVLFGAKHNFDMYTCSGIASMIKLEYIVNSCTKDETGKIYDFADINPRTIIAFVNNNIIEESVYRELARTEPWYSIWSSAKKNGRIFDKSGPDMSEEQCKLISYSHFYDQVHEHPECPHDSILKDDDMLDGWLIIQKREREKEQKTKAVEAKITNPKIANSQEIFLVAHNTDELRTINDLNSGQGAMIKNSRLNKIKSQDETKDIEFADVQRDIAMKHNEMKKRK